MLAATAALLGGAGVVAFGAPPAPQPAAQARVCREAAPAPGKAARGTPRSTPCRAATHMAAKSAGPLMPVVPGAARAPAREATPERVAVPAAETSSAADWAKTINRIAGSVVAIEIDQVRSFDTGRNESAVATGFVVDAKRGLILTNRHVVTPGPVVAEATFLDREQVQLFPVYRDPVHDFGFYRYDPSKLHYIHPKALPLVPAAAQVGREIRVVGNNAGEELSILAGTIARLHRAAPNYGTGRYNDFNTFYIQAASGTSGGSSGSPVIDIKGQVVALNAGGATGAASSFFLPLGRVVRALHLIQQGKPVTRGTLETEFRYLPFDQLRRLGLEAQTEAQVRKARPDGTGMLVVRDVIPGSPASRVLQPGDILVRVNGRLVTRFNPLGATLDDSVGKPVELTLQRGGRPYSTTLTVGNLDAITPRSYLYMGNAVVHTLSYELARAFHLPVRGVFVAAPGYMFGAAQVPRGAVITEVDSKPVNDLSDFVNAVKRLPDRSPIEVRYQTIDQPNTTQLATVRIDRHWYPARHCTRDDRVGYWQCVPLPQAPPPKAPQPVTAQLVHLNNPIAQALAPSLVFINFSMPYAVSGVNQRYYHGAGLIIDAKRGLVITDRNTVPVSLGDVTLTFDGAIQIPGRVVYINPLHNVAVVQYDPRLIGNTPVKSAVLATGALREGEAVTVVGMDDDGEIKARSTSISDVDPLQLPLSASVRFRDSNLEVATLVNPPDSLVGVLADRRGRVRGLWASFAWNDGQGLKQSTYGVSSDLVARTLQLVRDHQPLYSLEAELLPQSLANAHLQGLSSTWMRRIERSEPQGPEVLTVVRLVGGSDAARVLQTGDILLAIDGRTVTRFRQVQRDVAGRPEVSVTVWRNGAARTLRVHTAALSGIDLRRVVRWAGATLQRPDRAVSAQRGIAPTGVYVSYFSYGSPASHYGLFPGLRIVQAQGQPTPDLTAFLKAVQGLPNRASVRLTALQWNGAPKVITLRLDTHYWPAYELLHTQRGWRRISLE